MHNTIRGIILLFLCSSASIIFIIYADNLWISPFLAVPNILFSFFIYREFKREKSEKIMMLKLEYDRLSRTEKNKIVIRKRLKKFKKCF